MSDMGFLKKLGEEQEKASTGSTINGMSAEDYANMLDQKAEQGIDEPFYPMQPGTSMGGDEELPTTEIEDMTVPPEFARPKPPAPQKEGAPPKRYSENSYGNSAFMSAEKDTRTIRERRMAAANHSNESPVLGFVGALLGAVLGSAIWAVIALAGHVTWAGAIVVVLTTFFGYLLFARNIGTAGVFIIILAVAAGVFCGNRLSYSVSIHENRPEGTETAYSVTEELMSVKDIFTGESGHFKDPALKREYKKTLLYSIFAALLTMGILFLHRFG